MENRRFLKKKKKGVLSFNGNTSWNLKGEEKKEGKSQRVDLPGGRWRTIGKKSLIF